MISGEQLTLIGSLQKSAAFIAIALGIYLLQWGKDFIMPMVLSLLLTDVLSPSVDWLRNKRIPNALAVTIITSLLGVLVLGLILLLSQQVISLAAELPDYRGNIIEKVRSLRPTSEGVFARLTGTFKEVSRELSPPATTQATPANAPKKAPEEPVQVEVVGPSAQTAMVATGLFAPAMAVLGNAGVVFGLLFFFLLERDLVTHRISWLMRRGNMDVSSVTIDEASSRVGRYLRMQLIVNTCSGILVATVCWLFGVPNPMLLGAMAGALRYIPYIGPLVGMSLPTLLAIAVLPGWFYPAMVLASLLVVELITNMGLEPLLYGSSTGVSSSGVVVVAFFWGWLWGGMGLILAMPITVWIVLVGRHLPGVRPLAIALSSESIGSIESGDKCDVPVSANEPGWVE